MPSFSVHGRIRVLSAVCPSERLKLNKRKVSESLYFVRIRIAILGVKL